MESKGQDASSVVLIVVDDPALLQALTFSIELEGFQVEAYADAESVLAAAALPGRGCMIIDVQLPGVSGLELIKQLRARRVGLPAVLITTHPPASLRTLAAAADVPIVEKPLLQDELIDTVRRLVPPEQAAGA